MDDRTTATAPITAAAETAQAPLIQEISDAIAAPTDTVPTAGVKASADMYEIFDQAAERVEQLAQEAVDRAAALQLVAAQAANRLRMIGSSLRENIEAESARALQVGLVFEQASHLIGAHGQKP